MLTGWKYYWIRFLGWFPLQPCRQCSQWYWGGLPMQGWEPCMREYCSKACAEAGFQQDEAFFL